MVRALLAAALLALSLSPLDAREANKDRTTNSGPPSRGDLRRDIERISKEIYRPAPPARAPKKR